MYRFVVPLFAALSFAAIAHAQVGSTQPLTILLSPENPRPYEVVTVTPNSNLIDLLSSTVTVSVNGKVVEKGTGVQSVPVTMGAPGQVTSITVTATSNGQTYSSTVSLRPADVSLVVEPVSTTHAFYRGAALTAPEGRVRIIALPDLRTSANTRLNPNDLTYTWRFGDQILEGQSGLGRSILMATAPVRYRDAQISVTVTNSDSTIVAQTSTTINPVDPVVRIYENDPLMGPDFDHALSGGFAMSGVEDAFRGVAYYFGVTPALAWSVNNQSASNDQDVTVRTTGTGTGAATLSLTASGASGQNISALLPISFGAKKQLNIFGF